MDRDLTRFVIPGGGVSQDFSLVLFLGMRLQPFARAWARSVLQQELRTREGSRSAPWYKCA